MWGQWVSEASYGQSVGSHEVQLSAGMNCK